MAFFNSFFCSKYCAFKNKFAGSSFKLLSSSSYFSINPSRFNISSACNSTLLNNTLFIAIASSNSPLRSFNSHNCFFRSSFVNIPILTLFMQSCNFDIITKNIKNGLLFSDSKLSNIIIDFSYS